MAAGHQLRRCNLLGGIAHLLVGLAVLEDVLDRNVKLAQIVLAESISIPTNSFQKYTMKAINRQVECNIPLWVEALADSRCGLSSVTQLHHQELSMPLAAAIIA